MILIHLINIQKEHYKEESTNWQCSKTEAHVDFMDFGQGERKRYYQIVLDCKDVELIINGLAEKGSAHAKRIQKALNLVSAIEDIIQE